MTGHTLPKNKVQFKLIGGERCALRLQGDVSSFFINGQGGLPVWSKENYLPETIRHLRKQAGKTDDELKAEGK